VVEETDARCCMKSIRARASGVKLSRRREEAVLFREGLGVKERIMDERKEAGRQRAVF
jgi:hypothetical protein